jgi:hypothetical protein
MHGDATVWCRLPFIAEVKRYRDMLVSTALSIYKWRVSSRIVYFQVPRDLRFHHRGHAQAAKEPCVAFMDQLISVEQIEVIAQQILITLTTESESDDLR